MSSRARRRWSGIAIACLGWSLATTALADHGGSWDADAGHFVSIGHDTILPKGAQADDVVAIFGSSIADGDVADSVVAVFGDARVSGTVGNNTVAVVGNAYVNGKVDGNVVAVLGSITLGPDAEVNGQIVEVLGSLYRSPGALVSGGVERIFGLEFPLLGGLPAWVRHCLIYGRLLALDPAVGWAWGFALAALGLYVVLAALFGGAVERCVRTLDAEPGASVLAALVAVLISPVLYFLLLVTLVGIALIPIVWVGLLCAALFGKVVALAWLGDRCIHRVRAGVAPHVILKVLAGGLLMLALYLVPVVGFAAFALFALLGFGAVLYTLMRASSLHRVPQASAAAASSGGASAASGAPGGSSTAAPGAGAQAPRPAQAQLDESTLERAGFWIRIGALALDALIVGILLGLLSNRFQIELLALAVYAAVMWKLKATTVGGAVCDLKVIRLDGQPIDWGIAVVRALGCFLSLAVAGLGFVWIAIDPQRQAWHDKIAGTVVVRVPRGTPLL